MRTASTGGLWPAPVAQVSRSGWCEGPAGHRRDCVLLGVQRRSARADWDLRTFMVW